MKTIRKLLPGKPGTKKLSKQYGSDLVCVRYRYDSEKGLTLKTVEFIIEKGFKKPGARAARAERIVHLRIDYGEVELGRKVKAAGGKWDPRKRVWELPYKNAAALGLTERIIPDAGT